MDNPAQKFTSEINAWFAANPDCEFRIMPVPTSRVRDVAAEGLLAGIASQTSKTNDLALVKVPDGADAIPAIVRRAAPLSGRPLPGVLLLDGGIPMPPPPPASLAQANISRAEEQMAKAIWTMAQVAAASGKPPATMLGGMAKKRPAA